MIDKGVTGAANFDQPWTWFVFFHRDCTSRMVRRWLPDEFKHVSAVGFSSRTRTWIFYDPAFERTRIFTANDGPEAVKILAVWMANAVTVEMHVRPSQRRWWRPGGWCVPMIAHLLGIRSGAVLPSGLLRDCLENGGRIIDHAGECTDPRS